LHISFQNITLDGIKSKIIYQELTNTLIKKDKMVEQVTLKQVTGKQSEVLLTMQFARFKTIHNEKKENNLVVRWGVANENAGKNYKLIVDIFSQEQLSHIAQQNNILKQVLNTPQDPAAIKRLIVIDAGHGGNEYGAQLIEEKTVILQEKEITLDISRRIHQQLNKDGYRVLLTRTEDKNVSLEERARLANQLQADLFVSIHVDSSAEKTSHGMKMFYLDPHVFSVPKNSSRFFFANIEDEQKAQKTINSYLNRMHNASKNLAIAIQTSLTTTLEKLKIPTDSCQIKQQPYRILVYNSSTPAILVEVGFITEVHRFKKQPYRQILADGIRLGILSFVEQTLG
jgi:N-acetylmuramoyl-L-alanine amidase